MWLLMVPLCVDYSTEMDLHRRKSFRQLKQRCIEYRASYIWLILLPTTKTQMFVLLMKLEETVETTHIASVTLSKENGSGVSSHRGRKL